MGSSLELLSKEFFINCQCTEEEYGKMLLSTTETQLETESLVEMEQELEQLQELAELEPDSKCNYVLIRGFIDIGLFS
jgi:hypothetical protein